MEGGCAVAASTAGKSPYSELSHEELVEATIRHDAARQRLAEEARRTQAQIRARETQVAASLAEAVAVAATEKERAAWYAGQLQDEQAKVARLQSQVKHLELQLQHQKQRQEDATNGGKGADTQVLAPVAGPEPEPKTEPQPVPAPEREIGSTADTDVETGGALEEVPRWRTCASHLADTINIARALSKQSKQVSHAGAGAGDEQSGQARLVAKDKLIAYTSCQFGTRSEKKLFADLKQNEKGAYIKLSVVADGNRKNVFLPADSWSHVTRMMQAHS